MQSKIRTSVLYGLVFISIDFQGSGERSCIHEAERLKVMIRIGEAKPIEPAA
jgi:hypothetical protein